MEAEGKEKHCNLVRKWRPSGVGLANNAIKKARSWTWDAICSGIAGKHVPGYAKTSTRLERRLKLSSGSIQHSGGECLHNSTSMHSTKGRGHRTGRRLLRHEWKVGSGELLAVESVRGQHTAYS